MAVRSSDCGHLTITCDLQVSPPGMTAARTSLAPGHDGRTVLVGQNVRVRALLIGIIVILVALAGGAVGVDFGTTIYAEYRLSRTLRTEAGLGFDPWVSILGFPFIPQAMRHRYAEVEFRANGVDRPIIGEASLEATMYSIDLTQASWLVRPGAPLPVHNAEGRA